MNPDRPPTFAQAFRFWVKLGFISFGGPTGQIAIMHTELVEKKKWISESRFLHALNYCMLLPGPEAQQLAIYAGWLLHGTWGGIVAGAFFVIPSVFILLALSWVYAAHGNLPWIAAIFFGLKPAVMAIVAHAVMRIGKKALKNEVMYALAALAFVAIFFWHVPFPVIIAAAGLLGFLGGQFWPVKFNVIKGHTTAGGDEPAMALHPHALVAPTLGRGLRVLAVCLALWWTPVLVLGLWQGWQSVFVKESIFFSKAAMVTFGGAYAVLPYVAQAAVTKYGWLQAGQMLDGLGLAETTPGPLIMVLQFVGFMGGWQAGGLVGGLIGALITTWVTFVPCFLWIFLGAPYIERLRDQAKLSAALSAITAAVVGVVLNLAVWFGLHTLFPEAGGVNWFAVAVGVVAFLGMWRWKWGVIPVVVGSGILGLVYHWLR
ncbi:MAG: chromate efflux transporter [Verrucomicrobiota bacterium]